MLYRLWNLSLIATCLFNISRLVSANEALGLLVVCRNKPVNLNYKPQLPAAPEKRIIQNITDDGTWTHCQLGHILDVNDNYSLD